MIVGLRIRIGTKAPDFLSSGPKLVRRRLKSTGIKHQLFTQNSATRPESCHFQVILPVTLDP